ncbi:IPT/TIG domain-containing protein [Homoserinibacter sp. GY 40078]|uniref:phage tail tube protein n=1 Tax=Homoserinibacter sp. GY 40078 TaxID=2603275 RepID=UPI0011CB0741|nr:IPT/TIG domain-containing protein [Homoserinibacter sp. GY 40078]TXK17406.1 hypothetical protein FVQ89_11265 [Homoserinibacter sp. GY 40078]
MTAAIIENDRANNPDLVRLIKDGRILIGAYGVPDAPTGPDWDPSADIASGKRIDLGYYSDSGFTLTPEPGDNVNFKAHNSDVVLDEDGPGTWATQFSAIESGRKQAEVYFDAAIDGSSGHMRVSKASVKTFRDLVLVGISGDDDVVIAHFPRAKVADRDAITFGPADLNSYGMTLRAYRDPVLGYQFDAWSTLWIDSAPAAPTITTVSPAEQQAAAGNVVIDGTNLAGATVTIGGDLAFIVSNTATQIVVLMPGGDAGTADIEVTTSGGTASVTYDRV